MTSDRWNDTYKYRVTKGQALVEMALILPFLLFLIISALELGRVYYSKMVLTNAAREGAYYLSLNLSDSSNCTGSGLDQICFLDTRQAIMDEANNSGVSLSNDDIAISTPCCTAGQTLAVNATTTVNNLLVIGLLSNGTSMHVSNSSIQISATTQMVAQ